MYVDLREIGQNGFPGRIEVTNGAMGKAYYFDGMARIAELEQKLAQAEKARDEFRCSAENYYEIVVANRKLAAELEQAKKALDLQARAREVERENVQRNLKDVAGLLKRLEEVKETLAKTEKALAAEAGKRAAAEMELDKLKKERGEVYYGYPNPQQVLITTRSGYVFEHKNAERVTVTRG
jgi:chromosome segregation ATPase